MTEVDNRLIIEHNMAWKGCKMVKIRLRREGKRGRPFYRVVVAESRNARDGAFINIIGHFDPLTNPETVVINEETALKWLKQGAQPTATVRRLLTKTGIMEKFKPSTNKIKEPTKETT
jgi:small subunit ribosomal protein S16